MATWNVTVWASYECEVDAETEEEAKFDKPCPKCGELLSSESSEWTEQGVWFLADEKDKVVAEYFDAVNAKEDAINEFKAIGKTGRLKGKYTFGLIYGKNNKHQKLFGELEL